ncbi:MAG: glutamate synthase-related protein [Hyphomicrobiales bacterium]
MSDKSKPIIADLKPIKTELKDGEKYFWCRCGLSKNQPFCDGSHKGTEFTPLAFTAEKSGDAFLCQCKRTGNNPYCDGTHARLGDAKVGDPAPEVSHEGAPQAEPTPEEPTVAKIHALARDGLSKTGHHGEMGSMGVPRKDLPHWDDIQILAAQFARKPLMDDMDVGTELVIGPRAKKPLVLKIPLFVSDMSFGALSQEAKVALAKGAEMAGTGICSGEGGMLPEEQQANSRYFYELASAKFGWQEDLVERVQAFHFKGGQGAKTGTGGHLPGAKVTEKIAEVRGLKPGQDAISPPTFDAPESIDDFRNFSDMVRERSGGIPIGFKLSANHIEDDIDFALAAGADFIILDGRGGGTGAAPLLFRDHISVPTIPALARARRHLDAQKAHDVTLIITGGLRMPEDFIKAMAMGADGVAVSNSAIQAVGCVAARMCNTNNCPAGVATQKPELRKRLDVEVSAKRLATFFGAATELMQVMARACGHNHLSQFNMSDITTWKREMAHLSGVKFGGVGMP